jgi:hemerythrin-like domain-containing protein
VTTHDAVEEGPSGVYAECEEWIGAELSASLLQKARLFPQVPVAPHFDGEGSVRVAELALASARRMAAPRSAKPRSRSAREFDKLEAEHASFSKLLDLLQAQLALFHNAEQPDYELMRDVFDYLTSYADHFHHAKEDRIFQKLAVREPTTQTSVSLLAQQHQVIAHSGARFLGNLEAALAGAILPRAAVEGPAQQYVAFYRAHMKLEESELFPLARRLLCDTDWQELDAAPTSTSTSDPLCGASLDARYRALQRRIATAAECGCAVL